MQKLIDINSYPVSKVLKSLIKDRTTGKNIIFATNAYSTKSGSIQETDQITVDLLKYFGDKLIQPRVLKSLEQQNERTRKKAEVFTPSWICNKMNNHCDSEWFGKDNVFNIEDGQSWEPTSDPIEFEEPRTWQDYVDSKRLEITCGEAPYIVSRYDTTTAETIPIERRIGILDRKMRIINENTMDEKEWLKWTYRAFQSVYGFEFQGDNLLIARINLLISFVDYMDCRWGRKPDDKELSKIVNIITWNIWQMDGITGTVPFGKPTEKHKQFTFFDYEQGINDTEPEEVDCIIYDWKGKKQITYRSIKEGN